MKSRLTGIIFLGLVIACGQVSLAANAKESSNAISDTNSYCYYPCVVHLIGIIRKVNISTRWNWGFKVSNQNVKKKYIYILILKNPINVRTNDKDFDDFSNVRELEIFSQSGKVENSLAKFLGKQVLVTGSLTEAVTVHQHEKVLISAKNIILQREQ